MIYQFSPFLNENLIACIAAEEASNYGGAVYLTESNRDFHFRNKKMNFVDGNIPNLIHRYINVDDLFVENTLFGKIKLCHYRYSLNPYKRKILKAPTWYNESIQRNLASKVDGLDIEDDDIIILCDIDEIIDSRKIDLIIKTVRTHGIITGKLHFTMFFWNLFSKNWGGPEDYSYRLFVMTGDYYKNMEKTYDEMRKNGEAGKLNDKIYLLDDFIGFHHSWLGNEDFIKNKIESYAHIQEHKGNDSLEFIRECIKDHKSIFPNHILEMDNNIELLESVKKIKCIDEYSKYFL